MSGRLHAHFALQAEVASLWSAPPEPAPPTSPKHRQKMRQEIQTLVDEIKQAITLLRRHL
jgi:Spy/CpxP family protein refolding chaperone